MSIWKQINNDFDDRVEGTGKGIHIDAFRTEDDMEEGKTIAYVKDGLVTYLDNRAATDPLAQEKIQEVVKEQILDLSKIAFNCGYDLGEWFEAKEFIEEVWNNL